MKHKERVLWLALAFAGLLGGAGALHAAGFFTNGVPPAGGTQYPSTIPLTGNETLPADTNLPSGLNPASESISTLQLAGYMGGLPSKGNILIGGDATTNLWQRATTGASETTTYAYGGPDRWAYWSGASTAMTVSRDSTAANLPAGYQYDFLMQRTSGQTGVVPLCMAQEVESVNSYQMQGTTVELDFHAATGANFSPAAPYNMTAYIVYGTGTDEGMQKLAYGLNAGGGGSTGWTGQTNATAAVIPLGGVSTLGRYAAVGNIPVTATEVGVALCYTPVGTAGTNDYVAFSGIQLVRNSALASYASATVGYSCGTIACSTFDRSRSIATETLLQQRYFYQLAERATISPIASCVSTTTSQDQCNLQFPTTMRIAPVFTGDGGVTAGFSVATTMGGGTLGLCGGLTVPSNNPSSSVANPQNVQVQCQTATSPAAGSANILYNNGGAGKIKASAEL